MSETITTIRERVWTDNGTTGFYDTFVYEPSNTDERKLGSLFIAGALLVDKPSDNQTFLFNSVAALARRSFYNPPSGADSLVALEYALRQVNALLGKQAAEGELEWFGNLHLVIGCIDASSAIHVAHAGNPDILLIRDGTAHNIATVTEPEDEDDAPSHLRLFSAIASGELNEEDLLFISAPSLPDTHNAMTNASKHPTLDFFTLLHDNASLRSYAGILLDTRKKSSMQGRPFIDTLEKSFLEEGDTIAEPLPFKEIMESTPPQHKKRQQTTKNRRKPTKRPTTLQILPPATILTTTGKTNLGIKLFWRASQKASPARHLPRST